MKKVIEQIKGIERVREVVIDELKDNTLIVRVEYEHVAVECTNIEQFSFVRKQKGQEPAINMPTGVYNPPYVSTNPGHSFCKKGYYNMAEVSFSQYLTDYNLTDEWEKYLIGEAVKRGITTKGVKILSTDGVDYGRVVGEYGIKIKVSDNYLVIGREGQGVHLYNIPNGKWAEIVKDELVLVRGEIYYSKKYDVIFRSGVASMLNTDEDKVYESSIWDSSAEYRKEARLAKDKQKKKLIKSESKNNFFWELQSKNK